MDEKPKETVLLRVSPPRILLSGVAIVLALAALTGCQGFSTGKAAAQGAQDTVSGGLTATPATVKFGNVQIGTSQSQTVTLGNTSSSTLNVTDATVTGTGFNTTGLTIPLALSPGQSATFSVVFAPSAAGSVTGNLALTNDGSISVVNVALSGTAVTPGSLTANPTSFNFGSVLVGSSQTQSETLTNMGSENVTLSTPVVTGAGFSYTGLSLPLTLAPNQSTTFSVVFVPTVAGASDGTLSIPNSGSSATLDIALSGTGATAASAQLQITPSTINIGKVTVGTSGTQTGTLTAIAGTVTVASVSVGGSEFTVSGVPVTIPAGQTANFTVTFTPQSSGTASVTAVFTSNASNPSASVTLAGTGVAAPAHSVNLTWDASTSPNIIGYNVYRRTGSSGSFTRINNALDSLTAYTDSAVADGQTYYYETTAVNSSNEESAPSTPVKAVIPAP
jgi:hypothetical protein